MFIRKFWKYTRSTENIFLSSLRDSIIIDRTFLPGLKSGATLGRPYRTNRSFVFYFPD